MSEQKHSLSIWLFIGSLLLVYGLLILGSGIYVLSQSARNIRWSWRS